MEGSIGLTELHSLKSINISVIKTFLFYFFFYSTDRIGLIISNKQFTIQRNLLSLNNYTSQTMTKM